MTGRDEIVVVGPGFRFYSGISVYTARLVNALADRRTVGLIELDRLIPARLYPGGDRVGGNFSSLSHDPRVRRRGRVDWFWWPGLFLTVFTLIRRPPSVLVVQWWTAATAHTYLVLALVAKMRRIPFLIEFHETQDTGEAEVPGVRQYAAVVVPWLISLADGGFVHNEHDRTLLRQTFGARIDRLTLKVVPHGPYDHLGAAGDPAEPSDPTAVTRLLCFGLLRPYKGTEDVVAALDSMSPEEAADFELTVVGETWENWTLPAERIAASRYRDQITLVNRYVTDDEAARFHQRADVVVLPYRRGSSSGPLHIAMSHGLNVVMYAVGGLVEAASDYTGVTFVEPDDIDGLRRSLLQVRAHKDERHDDPHTWEATVAAYESLEAAVIAGRR